MTNGKEYYHIAWDKVLGSIMSKATIVEVVAKCLVGCSQVLIPQSSNRLFLAERSYSFNVFSTKKKNGIS